MYNQMKLGQDEFWNQDIGNIASAVAAIKPMILRDIYEGMPPHLLSVRISEHSHCSWVPAIHQAAIAAQAPDAYTVRLDDFPSRKGQSGV